MRYYTGIDVWWKWGVVTINDNCEVVSMYTIPSCPEGVDWVQLKLILEWIPWLSAIEDVHSIYWMSAKSNFNFWFIKGFKYSVLCDQDTVFVQPKTWQKTAWNGWDIVYKSVKPRKVKDTKATSLNAAQRIFPWVDWRVGRQRVQQDGLYDSALIAYRLMMQHKPERSITELTNVKNNETSLKT